MLEKVPIQFEVNGGTGATDTILPGPNVRYRKAIWSEKPRSGPCTSYSEDSPRPPKIDRAVRDLDTESGEIDY